MELVAAAAVLLLIVSTAHAQTTFNPGDGTGGVAGVIDIQALVLQMLAGFRYLLSSLFPFIVAVAAAFLGLKLIRAVGGMFSGGGGS